MAMVEVLDDTLVELHQAIGLGVEPDRLIKFAESLIQDYLHTVAHDGSAMLEFAQFCEDEDRAEEED